MAQSEGELLDLLVRLRTLHDDIAAARPATQPVDNSWDETLSLLDEATSAFGLAVYLACEALSDADAIKAGSARRLPSGEVIPLRPEPRQ